MAISRKIKCSNCGHLNINNDYCENCGELINPVLIREKQTQTRIDDRAAKEQARKRSKIGLWIERNKNHKNILVRGFVKLVYSIFIMVMAIGAFIAWLVGAVAA